MLHMIEANTDGPPTLFSHSGRRFVASKMDKSYFATVRETKGFGPGVHAGLASLRKFGA
jgi:hypothetical protein